MKIVDVEANTLRRNDMIRLLFMGGTEDCNITSTPQHIDGKIEFKTYSMVAGEIKHLVDEDQIVRRVLT